MQPTEYITITLSEYELLLSLLISGWTLLLAAVIAFMALARP